MRRLYLCIIALALAAPAAAMAGDVGVGTAVESGATALSKNDIVIGQMAWQTELSDSSAQTVVTAAAAIPPGRYSVRVRLSLRCDMPDGVTRIFSVSKVRTVRSLRGRGLVLRRTRLAADCAGGTLNPDSIARISLRISRHGSLIVHAASF